MAWRYPSELAARPASERIWWQIYNKGFERGTEHCHLAPVPPYKRCDYRRAWQAGYDDGRQSVEAARAERRLAREKEDDDE